MYFLYVYRLFIFSLCFVLNIAALGLIAHWTAGSNLDHTTESFEAMGLFTSIVTFLVLPTMMFVPFIRKNAFFLYIVFELPIISLLWIFWIVTAALVIQKREDFYPLGNCFFLTNRTVHWCTELTAIEGLTVTLFVILMTYILLLLTYALFSTVKSGSTVWFQSVKEQQINARLPALTHNPGDLEMKTGKAGSSSADISMTTYPTSTQSTPAPTYAGGAVQSTGYSSPPPPPPSEFGASAPRQANMQVTRPEQHTTQSQRSATQPTRPAQLAAQAPQSFYSQPAAMATYNPPASSLPQL